MIPVIERRRRLAPTMLAIVFACLLCMVAAVAIAVLGAQLEIKGVLLSAAVLTLGAFLLLSAIRPDYGLYALLFVVYTAGGMTRYINAPTGLLVDGVLLALFIALLIRLPMHTKWAFMTYPTGIGIGVWLLMCCFQLLNPEMIGEKAWLYAVRALALYWVGGYPVIMLLLDGQTHPNKRENGNGGVRLPEKCLYVILALSSLGALWALKQDYIGLNRWESAWMQKPEVLRTHMLDGRLRAFSFYTDTAQFAVNMAYCACIAIALACGRRGLIHRIILLCAVGLYCAGLMSSHTRSAYGAFIVGIAFFLILHRSFRVLLIGGILLVSAVCVLKFTYVGQGYYAVQRMRQAVSPLSDPSFRVRLYNQQRLAFYLEDHPFGGGIGSVGYWGRRFAPDTFLANLEPDSWYVRIAAEQGYPGLLIYLIFILGLGARGIVVTMREPNARWKNTLEAYVSAYWAVAFTSYSNQYLGQIPTGFVMLIALCVIEHAAQNQHRHAEKARELARRPRPRNVIPSPALFPAGTAKPA